MKKVIIIGLLIMTLTMLFVSAYAFAETTEQQICSIAMQNEKVKAAKCLVYERNCVIAIKTEKFTTKTEYEQYLKKLTDEIKTKFEIDNVCVTRNPKIMKKIEMLEKLDEDKRNKLIQEIIDRELNKEHPPINGIMPRSIVW